MKKIIALACITFICSFMGASAQRLSTATGRGRHIKNEMLLMVEGSNYKGRYRLWEIDINDPKRKPSVIVLDRREGGTWVRYKILRKGDLITLRKDGKAVAQRRAKVK